MIPILTRGDADLKYGYFYSLYADFPDPYFEEEDSWIISEAPNEEELSCGVPIHIKLKSKSLGCRLDTSHRKQQVVVEFGIDLYSRSEVGSFLPIGQCYLIIRDRLLEMIKGSGLEGWKVIPAEIAHHDLERKPEVLKAFPKLYHWSFDGEPPFMKKTIVPKSADRCPFCGHGPLICPDCGFFSIQCRHCEKTWVVASNKHKGIDDPRIRFEPPSLSVDVFDPCLWDGSDFMGDSEGSGGYVTRRVVDFLLSVHAYPFKAEPIPVNVRGASKADLRRLEQAKAPLPVMK